MVRRASYGLLESAGFCVARASAPLRWLSLGSRRSTPACCAQAPCRAGCGCFAYYATSLHRLEASLRWRATVVRRAGCAFENQPAFAWQATRDRATALAASQDEAQRASFLRVRAVRRLLWSVDALTKATAPARGLSRAPRGRRFTWKSWPPESAGFCVARTSALLLWLSLERRRSTRACCCARAVPRWLWSVRS